MKYCNNNDNKALHQAREEKNDEFYTQITDIHKCLQNYKENLENKIVYCNCDNPKYSNFYKYLKEKFNDYKLKSLIATYHNINGEVEKIVFNGEDEVITRLTGNGEFDSEECVEVLKGVDVVVTNPPFSKFRQFFNLLMEYEKDFIVLSLHTATGYVEIFPYMKDNKVEAHTPGELWFNTPNGEYKSLRNVIWLSSFILNDKPFIKLKVKYDSEVNKRYDNYNAIEVSRVDRIPQDYDGIMGVPITIFNKLNHNQFTVLGQSKKSTIYGVEHKENTPFDPIIDGRQIFTRVFIKRKRSEENDG